MNTGKPTPAKGCIEYSRQYHRPQLQHVTDRQLARRIKAAHEYKVATDHSEMTNVERKHCHLWLLDYKLARIGESRRRKNGSAFRLHVGPPRKG